MECSCTIDCSMDNDLDVLYDVLIDKNDFIASRETDCEECNNIIAPGEKHHGFVCIVEDDESGDGFIRYHRCKECDEIVNVFYEDYPAWQIWQYLEEQIFDDAIDVPESCLVKLSPENRARVCEFIENAWENMEELDEAV